MTIYEWARGPKGGTGLPPLLQTTSSSSSSAWVYRQPREGNVNRDPQSHVVRIFVGTWNTEYGEFSTSAMLASEGAQKSAVTTAPSSDIVPSPDAVTTSFPVGSRTAYFETLRATVLPPTPPAPPPVPRGRRRFTVQGAPSLFVRARVSTEEEPDTREDRLSSCPDADDADDGDEGSDDHDSPTSSKQYMEGRHVSEDGMTHSLDREPLEDWIKPGYDVYVIALQEVTADRFVEVILTYLNRSVGHQRRFVKVDYAEDKISGLGDGAYLSMKSTAIACFVADDMLESVGGPVNIGSSKGISLSSVNGSKGAVAIILTVHEQIVCFLSCHLPPGKPAARVKARSLIQRRLAEAFCGLPDTSPTDVFHHIVWVGDFNARVQEVRAKTVLKLLTQGQRESAFAFDEFNYANHSADLRESGFEEPEVTFLPTYKKFAGRDPFHTNLDADALTKTYNINFKVRWYKNGKVKERAPSWTDRILKWSHPELRSCFVCIPGTYLPAEPRVRTFLLCSDHDPLGCGFLVFSLAPQYKVPAVLFFDKKQSAQ